jgi:CBS domain-containing protein
MIKQVKRGSVVIEGQRCTMKIADIMTKQVTCCTPTHTAHEAAELMKLHDVGALPVICDSEQPFLEGIVTDRDLCCAVLGEGKSPGVTLVADLMTRDPVTCGPEDSVGHCEKLMEKHSVRRIPVVDSNGCCIGIVSQVDLASHASRRVFRKLVAKRSKHSRNRHPRRALST